MRKRWRRHVTWRAFLRALAAPFGILSATGAVAQSPPAGTPGFSMAVLRAGSLDSAQRAGFDAGLALGLREARHAAVLFGSSISVIEETEPVDSLVTDAVKRLASAGAQAIVIAGTGEAIRLAAHACEAHEVVCVNALSPDMRLRDNTCGGWVFHLAASEAMASAARSLSRNPGARIEMWDSSLFRFGAAQLNDRFRASGRTATSSTWAGWMSAKILWEASLRATGRTARSMRDFLVSDAAQFDGHKGVPLSFRSWNRQLRQPLYARADGSGRIVEVPEISGDTPSIRAALDVIGEKPGGPSCSG